VVSGVRLLAIIIDTFIVLRDLTTRACGNACWICSPRLVSLPNARIPVFRSSAFAASIRTLPFKFSAPALLSTSSEAVPKVGLITISPNSAACRNVPYLAPPPAFLAQTEPFGFDASREPMKT
jgi:hypothetical protein